MTTDRFEPLRSADRAIRQAGRDIFPTDLTVEEAVALFRERLAAARDHRKRVMATYTTDEQIAYYTTNQ